jgi:hypothetical protein
VRSLPLTRADFSELHLLVALEGGAIYTAERQGKFYLVQDESSMADLLDEQDRRDIARWLLKVLEFDTAAERSICTGSRVDWRGRTPEGG